MPRKVEQVRPRLQLAALEMFQQAGYEATTAAAIAARAGVTELTFFRHFPDKREVLFDGEALLTDALTSALRHAPPQLGPWETLLRAFRSIEPMFVANRSFSEPRQLIIAGSPALQERERYKSGSLIAALGSALCERGVEAPLANLAAQMGMAALGHAFACWFDAGPDDLDFYIIRAFDEVRALSSSSLGTIRPNSVVVD